MCGEMAAKRRQPLDLESTGRSPAPSRVGTLASIVLKRNCRLRMADRGYRWTRRTPPANCAGVVARRRSVGLGGAVLGLLVGLVHGRFRLDGFHHRQVARNAMLIRETEQAGD